MIQRIEHIVSKLLAELNIDTVPVPVKKVAKNLGLTIQSYDLGSGVSGALLIKNESATIAINPLEPEERTRFTIAHEIGHFYLHRSDNELFVDRDVLFQEKELNGVKMLFRDGSSSTGEKKQEREANAFAASLLMPVQLLAKKIQELDLAEFQHDEDIINHLSKKFKVSNIAMTYRLTNLGLLH